MMQTDTRAPDAPMATQPDDARLDLDRIPGPAPAPVIGPYASIIRTWTQPLAFFDQLAYGGYGRVVSFSHGMQRGVIKPGSVSPGAVFAFGSDAIQQVLHKRFEASFADTLAANFPIEWTSASRLNNSLIWMTGEPHRQRRKVVTPLYHQRVIQNYRDDLVALIGATLDQLAPGQTIEMMEWTGRILVAFQSQSVLGTFAMPGDVPNVGAQMGNLLKLLFNPLALFGPPLPFTPRGRVHDLASRVANNLAVVIERKRGQSAGRGDVVDMLVGARYEDGNPMIDSDIIAEIFGLFLGGWFSSRTSIAWSVLLLAQHPKLAADLYDELTSVLHGEAPTVEQLRSLPLLDGVIKETLRLLPPFPVLTRFVSKQAEIAGYRLPVGTEVWLGIHHTHRDPDVFPEPDRFKPERWISSSSEPGPYAYLPFGVGSRTCPGSALANLQMKLLLAMLVQRYRLELPPDCKVDHSGMGMAFPKPDVKMIVRRQDGCFRQSRKPVRGSFNRVVALDPGN